MYTTQCDQQEWELGPWSILLLHPLTYLAYDSVCTGSFSLSTGRLSAMFICMAIVFKDAPAYTGPAKFQTRKTSPCWENEKVVTTSHSFLRSCLPLIVARKEKSVFSKKKKKSCTLKSPSSAVVSHTQNRLQGVFYAFCYDFFWKILSHFFFFWERKDIKLHRVGNKEDQDRVAEGENIMKSIVWKNV